MFVFQPKSKITTFREAINYRDRRKLEALYMVGLQHLEAMRKLAASLERRMAECARLTAEMEEQTALVGLHIAAYTDNTDN